MTITANKLFMYLLVTVLTILTHVYSNDVRDFVIGSYQSITATPSQQQTDQDEFDVCLHCRPSALEVFTTSMIVLAPLSLLIGFAVWFGKQVLLSNKKTPHQVPATIWRKR